MVPGPLKNEDCVILQASLEHIVNWGLKFNSKKFKAMSCTQKRTSITYDYTMHNLHIKWVTSFSDLGLTVDSKVTWSEHVSTITNNCKANIETRPC